MEDSDLTVSEASEASGFSYAHHFIRVFKSLEGITPGQYRKNVTERNRSAAR